MILEDSQTSEIAHDYNCKIHDIYIKALSMGVCPYRYLRDNTGQGLKKWIGIALFSG